MGHAPSSECCNNEPFVVDLESKGKGFERLAAIALTEENMTSIKSSLFQGLYAARCDESVRHWYCAPKDRSTIPQAPAKEFIYERFVQQASEYVQAAEEDNTDPSDFTPLPIVLIKLPQDAVVYHPENGQLLTTLELLGTNPTFEVMGYFGCRHFGAKGEVDSYGTIGMFLAKTFNNEAKSVSILEIACRCYQHFMAMYGMTHTPWPKEIHFETLDSNMPCLRLMQKLLVSSQQALCDGVEIPEESLSVQHDLEAERLKVIARGDVVAKFAEHLAAQVTTQDSVTFNLHTRPVEPCPAAVVHPKLDEVILGAKKKWSAANKPVVEAYAQQKQARQAAAQQQATDAVSNAAAATRRRAASSQHQHQQTQAPFPRVTVQQHQQQYLNQYQQYYQEQQQQQQQIAPTSYRHCVYDAAVIEDQYKEDIPMQQQQTAEYDELPTYQCPEQPEQDIEQVSALFLAKKTPISFWKQGRWTHAQWRDEAMVRLCPVQHDEDNGMLAVELMYPSQTPSGCVEISIFDELSRPAKVRLDKPSLFYVPVNSLYHRDLSTKRYIPFSVGTEIAPAQQQQQYHEVEQPVNHYIPAEGGAHSMVDTGARYAAY